MKARFALAAFCALLSGGVLAAGTFKIYFNGTNQSSNCYVDNVTNISVQADGSVLAATSDTPNISLKNALTCGVSTAPTTYTIGGSVNGQTGAFTLAVTAGSQTVSVGSSAPSYAFPTAVATGTPYTVSVSSQPAGQTCTVTNGSGTIASTNVTNANISCTTTGTNTYTIGGSVGGLTASGLVMAVTAGSQTVSVASGATSYLFASAQPTGTGYTVSVQTQPTGLTCLVANATGTIGSANVTNVNVSCSGITGSSCTQGQASDIAGTTALCGGPLSQHDGSGTHSRGSGNYTFDFVFGGAWPGANSGYAEIFTLGATQFLSIPFTPAPGHSVSFAANSTYMPNNNAVFSISTQPGLFNKGVANGSTVICANKQNPNLTTTSNGSPQNNCVLNSNTKYWLNMIPGTFQTGTFTACVKTPCNIAVQETLNN